MKSYLIQNARIIDPAQKISASGSILVVNGNVEWLNADGQRPPAGEYEIIEAGNLIACPGFIDLHCHLREPGFEDKETIATGAAAAARGGYTTICCMPNTQPPVDSQAVVNYIKEKAAAAGRVRVLPIGCITKNRQGEKLAEMGELAEAGVIGFSDDGDPVMNSRLMRQALDYSRAFDLPVIEHCEDKVLNEGGQMNEGAISTLLGLPGMPAAGEESMVARNIALAELTGARLHIAHCSTAGTVALVRKAKQKGVKVTAEVTPHHLVLTEELVVGYDTNAKVNPPLRTRQDNEALLAGLLDGTIDAIATDHAPHTQVDKLCEFGYAPFGISGLETAFGLLAGLVHEGKIDLEFLIAKMTVGPASIIGRQFGNLGTLAVGCPADIALIDPDMEWTVDPGTFASKGKNTPLAGMKLKGKITQTFFGGEIVYGGKEG